MPGTDGITATGQLRQRIPATRVLVLTTYADDATIVPALRARVLGYLTKDASAEQIEAAIRAVHAGHTDLDPAVQEHLVAAVTSRRRTLPKAASPPGSFPPGSPPARPRSWPARRRSQQRRDRPAPVRQQRHRENPHQPDLRQDRRPRPRPSRPVRLPDRTGQPSHLTTRIRPHSAVPIRRSPSTRRAAGGGAARAGRGGKTSVALERCSCGAASGQGRPARPAR